MSLVEVVTADGEVVSFKDGVPVMAGHGSRVHLSLPEGMSFEEWTATGDMLRSVEHSVLWWIGDWLNYGERRYGEMYAQAIEATGYSIEHLKNAKWVAGAYKTSERSDVLPWSHHLVAAPLPRPDRAEALSAAEANGWSVRDLKADVKRRRVALALPSVGEVAILTARYDVVVMDPPWPMQKIEREARPNQVGFDYPTMSEEELAGFGAVVDEIAAEDCHLFVWTTQKFLPLTLDLLEQWGFRYVLTMVWKKPGGFQPIGLPQYNCEFVVYARRGSPDFVDTKAFPTCFEAPRREHSRKPDEFYDLIRRVTDGRRIDVFSREPRQGFDQYGNEVDKFAEVA